MSNILADELRGVPSDSPTDLDYDQDPELDPASDDDVPPTITTKFTASESGDDDDNETGHGEGKPGRTLENVYREMIRRQERSDKQIQMLADKFAGAMETFAEKLHTPAAPVKATDPDDPNQMSVAQLKALRSQVKPEQKDALEDMIRQREIDEAVNSRLSQVSAAQHTETLRASAIQQARTRFRDLNDPTSDFYKEVNKELAARGSSWVQQNPTAVYDAANAVAARQALGFSGIRTNRPNSPQTPRSNKPAPKDQGDESLSLSEQDAAAIAQKLQRALPAGKKFDLKKMRKGTEAYRKNINLHIS